MPGKGRADYFAPGDWNVACSMCGRKRKASTLVRNWQGLYRCPEHNEQRQPQDFARGVKDIQTVPFAQLETDKYVNVCTPLGCTAVADFAVAGCMIAGNPLQPWMIPSAPYFPIYIYDSNGNPILDGNGNGILQSPI